jgi:hypothetical protein
VMNLLRYADFCSKCAGNIMLAQLPETRLVASQCDCAWAGAALAEQW